MTDPSPPPVAAEPAHQPLPCIACGMQPEPAFRSEEGTHQPYGATMFYSHGHYGSTVWDPMSGNRSLQLNVCDDCLRARCDRVEVVTTLHQPSEVTYAAWSPPDRRAVDD